MVAQSPIYTLAVVTFCVALGNLRAGDAPQAVRATDKGLDYQCSDRGDRVPDFSYCGYASGTESPPNVPAVLTISPSGGDDSQSIQSAIDQLSKSNANDKGWRGAVQLSAGEFKVSGSLRLHGERIVLRGASRDSTTIVATGHSRRPLIMVGALPVPAIANDAHQSSRIVSYVPVGAMSIKVESATNWSVGQRVRVVHPSTAKWIAALGMNTFPSDDGRGSWLDWRPGSIDQSWERTIVAISDNSIQLDAPITSSIDPNLTDPTLVATKHTGRSLHVGVEHLTLVSQVDTSINPKDEEHAWDAIQLNDVEDAWIQSINCRNFVGSAVHVGQRAFRVTVADCKSLEPVSEDAGWRRHSFYTIGQQVLFLRCQAEDGRHDFSVGPLTPGPNAFVYCSSRRSHNFSGPIGSWATGVLYDNVEIDGAGLSFTNRETAAQGTGWAAANCLMWNCVAPIITCRKPPTANNWAIGVWGEFVGDGAWHELNSFTSPNSIFAAQLAERIGAARAESILREKSAPTKPTLPTADQPIGQSKLQPTLQSGHRLETNAKSETADTRLLLRNGWLVIGDRLATGKRMSLSWWRGSVLPEKVAEFGPGLTRFVPGRAERYYTDDIADVAKQMQDNGHVALEHHWGLWYDRRRDDHQMVRRLDGDAWPPFYELPWARSGIGQAWDGLSRYDLTRFNQWYFDRLEQFAEQADRSGLVLMQYMYFQHNILEAGAHWADFPWRPANCIQETGFQEPPRYENRKRIFMADDFYDVSNPVRRDLHVRYIRHCLDKLGPHSNVLFALGEEFTGPTQFVRFWLDTIRQWEKESGREVLVVLSATRDVQEAILADNEYASQVDVIDMKYWWYTSDGEAYDPPAGNLAPRQQLREWKGPKGRSSESLCRGVIELRKKFPTKAVLCSIVGGDPWSLLAAGASLPELPAGTNEQLLREITATQPKQTTQDFELHFELQHELERDLKGELDRERTPLLIVSKRSLLDHPASDAQNLFVPIDRKTGQPIHSKSNTLPIDSGSDGTKLPSSNLSPFVLWRQAR